MNLVVLDENPVFAARYLCETHLYQMVPAALLVMRSAALAVGVTATVSLHDPGQITTPIPREPDPKHPWALWASSSNENYLWLAEFAEELCKEYKRRFKNEHHDYMAIKVLSRFDVHFPRGKMTPFPQDMLPSEFQRKQEPVKAYRDWYACKADHMPHPFFPDEKGKSGGQPPNWWFDCKARKGM